MDPLDHRKDKSCKKLSCGDFDSQLYVKRIEARAVLTNSTVRYQFKSQKPKEITKRNKYICRQGGHVLQRKYRMFIHLRTRTLTCRKDRPGKWAGSLWFACFLPCTPEPDEKSGFHFLYYLAVLRIGNVFIPIRTRIQLSMLMPIRIILFITMKNTDIIEK
jgi:hypothetical protein